MFGASEDLGLTAGEWQVSFNYRGLHSDDHYRGTRFQYGREALNTYVVNTQQLYDLGATYNVTDRFSVGASAPVVNATWSLPMPTSPTPGPRREQNSSGLGDVSVSGRYWLLDPTRHPRGNVSAGLGIKAPTGKYDVEDEYPDRTGSNKTSKAVDQSIQPGDGGWGILFDFQAYKRLKRVTFFGAGSYLANPRDTNGTPSIVAGLGVSGAQFAGLLENSVPDQYLARAGAAFPFPRHGVSASLAFRVEGLPRYDLIGDSHGWRRPGYETFVEPGVSVTAGRSTWSLYVPIGLVRNRRPNPYTGLAGDATFPDHIVLLGYSYRFPARTAPAPAAHEAPPPGQDIR